jgi:hypothetical protein
MGVAVGASPLGPFTKSTGNPILRSGPGASGAGGGSLVAGPRTGGDELVYHAREGSGDDSRTLRIDRVVWNDAAGTVSIDGPTNGERPLP